jgi:hypothetical protein
MRPYRLTVNKTSLINAMKALPQDVWIQQHIQELEKLYIPEKNYPEVLCYILCVMEDRNDLKSTVSKKSQLMKLAQACLKQIQNQEKKLNDENKTKLSRKR